MTKTDQIRSFLITLAFVTLTGVLRPTSAAPIEFTIDEAQSKITLAGKVAGFSLQQQGPGSLTTTFSGKIFADVGSAAVTFTGGSTLAAITNGVWQPGPGGADGSALADFAGQASVPFVGTAKGALRNLLLDVTSTALPISNGQFDAAGLVFGFPATSTASFDYSAPLLGHDGVKLSGLSTNKIVNGATVIGASGSQTLTIQIDTEFVFTAISDNDSSVRLTGKLVAVQAAVADIELTSIEINGQNVVVRAIGVGTTAALEASTDLKTWAPQTATRTEDTAGTVFTFPSPGLKAFFRMRK